VRANSQRVLVVADDLIWSERLERLLAEAGASPARAINDAGLEQALSGTDAAVVDLTARAYDPIRVVERCAQGGRPVLAVGQHDDVALRKRALAAGAERVLAYRKLFDDGPATLRAWLDRAALASGQRP
jgi:CheY-like chemotaxis protein